MPVWKRWDGKKVVRGDKNYDRATWVASGSVEGHRYNTAFPREKVKTAAEARVAEEALRQSKRSGDYAFLIDKTRFSEFVDNEYLPYAKEENDSYETKVFEAAPLKTYFKDALLKSFTPQSCEKYKNWRKAQFKRCQKCAHNIKHECRPEIISPSTVNREMTTLSAILERAIFLSKIKENPVQAVKKLREPEARERFLTLEEKERLLAETSKHTLLHLFVLIGILTGWRSGQILSLRRSDLDEPTHTATLIRSKQQKPRRVTVGDQAWKILLYLAERSRGDYLFYNPKTQTRYLSFKRKWGEALQKTGIENLHFHDLRRTFATDMLRLHASDLVIKNALGHSNLQTTSIYARSDNETMREALNAVGDGLSIDVDAIIERDGMLM